MIPGLAPFHLEHVSTQAVPFGSVGSRRDVEDARNFNDEFRQICAQHHVDFWTNDMFGNDARIDGSTGRTRWSPRFSVLVRGLRPRFSA